MLRRQSSAAATAGRTHQNTSFVECGRSARPHSTKLGCFAVFGVRRTGAALRVGLPSLGPGAVVRPRPSFGGAAPPRAALRRALPFGPLGGGALAAPSPRPPPPCGGRGSQEVKRGDEGYRLNGYRDQDTGSTPPPRIRDGARGPGPRPIGEQ